MNTATTTTKTTTSNLSLRFHPNHQAFEGGYSLEETLKALWWATTERVRDNAAKNVEKTLAWADSK